MIQPTQYDSQNIIAKIIRGEIPNYTVYEDDEILSFMDIMPQSNGHLLVVTKKPSISLVDADPENLSYLIKKIQTIAQAMEKYFDTDGILLRQSTGEIAGQTIFHLHFHLIPMKNGEKLNKHANDFADAEILKKQASDLQKLLA